MKKEDPSSSTSSQLILESGDPKNQRRRFKRLRRRSFLKGIGVAGAASVGAGLLAQTSSAFAQEGPEEHSGRLTRGDAALLRFAAAAEILETDFWVQYNELGGIPDSEVPGGSGNAPYTAALAVLDEDMAQYIHDNTDDEFTHQNFLNAYLASKGASTVNLEPFRTLPGSTATGSSGKLRLTNLTQLTAFHFPTIEQGGNSLYPSMAQRATHVEVLRILISIGPTETMHFQTWSDKAGNAPPLTAVDPVTGVSVTFPDLNSPPFGGEDFQTNLIMPEPCPFLSRKLPVVSIIRPTQTKGIAMGVVNFLAAMGLFIGQSPEFFAFMRDLAEDADEARRGIR